MNKVIATMAGLTVSAAMEGLTNIMWAPMDDFTVSAAMSGLTNVLQAPMADLVDFPHLLWASDS